MPARIKYNRRAISRLEYDADRGLTFELGIQVLDIPVNDYPTGEAGEPVPTIGWDPWAQARCLTMFGTGVGDYKTRFPQMGDPFPEPIDEGDPDLSHATVTNQIITGMDSARNIVNATIRYQSPLGPQGPSETIVFSLDQGVQQAFIKTHKTADGSEVLSGWYLKGAMNTSHKGGAPPAAPYDYATGQRAPIYDAPAQKLTVFDTLIARGYATATQWNAVKSTIRAARGHINSDTAGVWAPRGNWLFLGPQVRANTSNTLFEIQLTFIEGLGSARWFPIIPFIDRYGRHPADSATEADLAIHAPPIGFPPPVGRQIRINGLTMASVQPETEFATKFTFGPIA